MILVIGVTDSRYFDKFISDNWYLDQNYRDKWYQEPSELIES